VPEPVQPFHTYCSPAPLEGEIAAIVTDELALTQLVPTAGDVVPKLVAIVNRYWVCQLAVSLIGLFIVTDWELLVPLYDPEPEPLQDVNTY
jgi:hypothetical protein